MVSGSPIVAAFERARKQRAQHYNSTTQHAETLLSPSRSTEPNENTILMSKKEQHTVHNVLPIFTRRQIVAWMQNEYAEHGIKKLPTKTVSNFPQYFRGSKSANFMSEKRLWDYRDKYIDRFTTDNPCEINSSITRAKSFGHHRVRCNARAGRGQKPSAWVDELHLEMRDEFDRLRHLDVKVNISTLRQLANHILWNCPTDFFVPT